MDKVYALSAEARENISLHAQNRAETSLTNLQLIQFDRDFKTGLQAESIAQIHLRKGLERSSLLNYGLAITSYEQALGIDKNSIKAQLALARCLIEKAKNKYCPEAERLSSIDSAVQISGKLCTKVRQNKVASCLLVSALYYKGSLLEEMASYHQAIDVFKQSVEKSGAILHSTKPQSEMFTLLCFSHLNIGRCHNLLFEFADAETSLTTASKVLENGRSFDYKGPELVFCEMSIALALSETRSGQNQINEGQRLCARAIELGLKAQHIKNYKQAARVALTKAYLQKGHIEEDGDSPETSTNSFEKCVALSTRILKVDREILELYLTRAKALTRLAVHKQTSKDFSAAAQLLRKALTDCRYVLSVSPEDFSAKGQMAKILLARGNLFTHTESLPAALGAYAEGVSLCDNMLQHQPDCTTCQAVKAFILYRAANAERRMKQYTEAEKFLLSSLSLYSAVLKKEPGDLQSRKLFSDASDLLERVRNADQQ